LLALTLATSVLLPLVLLLALTLLATPVLLPLVLLAALVLLPVTAASISLTAALR